MFHLVDFGDLTNPASSAVLGECCITPKMWTKNKKPHPSFHQHGGRADNDLNIILSGPLQSEKLGAVGPSTRKYPRCRTEQASTRAES